MSNEKHCPGCGTAVVSGQPHCPACGKDLAGLWTPSIDVPVGTGQTPIVGATGQTPQVQPGAAPRPWPFSSEILAERLVVSGYLQKPAVDEVTAAASASGASLVSLILERKLLAPGSLRDAMCRIFGLQPVDIKALAIDPTLVATFPSELARRHMFLPIVRHPDRLVMGVVDPTQAEAIRSVRKLIGLTIDLRLADEGDLAPLVHQYFSPRLVAVMPSGETLDIVVPDGEIKIGRADHNDVVLPDPTVGTTHAVLISKGNEFQIVDFGSRNGVFVDGNKIANAHTLKNGDVIQLGQTLLTFKLPLPEASHDMGGTQILTPDQIKRGPGPVIKQVAAAAPAAFVVPTAKAPEVVEEDDGKKKKGKKGGKKGDNEKITSAWIGFTSRILAQIVGAAATIILGLAVAGKLPMSCHTVGSESSANQDKTEHALNGGSSAPAVPTMLFPEMPGEQPHNASGIVPAADAKFMFVDNNVNESMFELNMMGDGQKNGPIVPHPMTGVTKGQFDDLEGFTLAEQNGKRYLIATTSLFSKSSKKNGEFGNQPSALVRVQESPDGTMTTDVISDFRDWFLKNVPDLGTAAILEPDEGGLNVEGLAWDPKNSSLLFGIRTPTKASQPLVVPVKVNDLAGAWTTTNLVAQPAVHLAVETETGDAGIRDITYDSTRNGFLVLVGNATSQSRHPFQLYFWDGNAAGETKRFKDVWFDKGAKPEGIAHGTIGGKGAVVMTDDAGGYMVLFDSDPRLVM